MSSSRERLTGALRRAARVALVAGVGWTLIACQPRDGAAPEKAAAAARRLPPDEARLQELLQRDANSGSDPALADEYDAISAQYFDNKLPAATIRWEPDLAEVGPLIADGFVLEGVTNGRLILLNPTFERDRDRRRAVLCHEIVHVTLGSSSKDHGAQFQSVLRRLFEAGAFTGLMASDEERSALRADLDSREERLKRELTELRADRAELEAAASASPGEAARARDLADLYNSRVQAHNRAVVELNEMIGRYNLMTAYPDGLDRDRRALLSTVDAR